MAAKDSVENVRTSLNPPRKIAYNRLTDPQSQIRLLNLEPGHLSEPIKATLRTYNRKRTPFYDAISYTWGDATLTKTLYINGQPVDVRFNCWYALWQARCHRTTHFWIDSLCINQDDNEEKSDQVREMHETFRGAYAVHCSVGEHAADSEWFCKHLGSFQEALNRFVTDEDARKCEGLFFKVFMDALLKTDSDLERFVAAYNAFCSRPYWSRLWTLQELVFGQRKKIWCGSSVIDFAVLMKLYLTFTPTDHEQHILTMGDIHYFCELQKASKSKLGHRSKLMPMKQPGFFKMLCSKQCSDPRDLFFGSRSIINIPIDPDYSKSAAEVAMEAIYILVTSDKYGAGKAARWTNQPCFERYREDILLLLKRMEVEATEHTLKVARKQFEHGDQEGVPILQRPYITLPYLGPVGQLRTNASGQLYINWDRILTSKVDHDLFHDSMLHRSTYQEQGVKNIFSCSGLHIGVVSTEAREGDLLIPNGSLEGVGWPRYLLVGWHFRSLFSIIGQAVVFPPLKSSKPKQGERRNGEERFRLDVDFCLDEFINTCLQAMIPAGVNAYGWAISCAKIKLNQCKPTLWTSVKRLKEDGVTAVGLDKD